MLLIKIVHLVDDILRSGLRHQQVCQVLHRLIRAAHIVEVSIRNKEDTKKEELQENKRTSAL